MGQKVNPIGLRLGITRTWDSVWFSQRNYSKWLHEDLNIKKQVKKEFYQAGIAGMDIERSGESLKLIIHTAKAGMVVGRKGVGIERIKKIVGSIAKDAKEIFVQPVDVKKPDLNAQLVAENIADQLERRAHFRRAMKRAIGSAMKGGVEGIKVQLSGRLGGAEMSRVERYHEGRTPLHTLRTNIEYGTATARTTYGAIGVKVWVSRGEVSTKNETRNNFGKRRG
ncbi:30S ribosomal protein S3 [bacterium]|nr:30S ribosomal protein S3 [bacterium]